MSVVIKVTRDQIVKRGDMLVVSPETGAYAIVTADAFKMMRTMKGLPAAKPAPETSLAGDLEPSRAAEPPTGREEALKPPAITTSLGARQSETREFRGRTETWHRKPNEIEMSRLAILDWATDRVEFLPSQAMEAVSRVYSGKSLRNVTQSDVTALYENGHLTRREMGGGKFRRFYVYSITKTGVERAGDIGARTH